MSMLNKSSHSKYQIIFYLIELNNNYANSSRNNKNNDFYPSRGPYELETNFKIAEYITSEVCHQHSVTDQSCYWPVKIIKKAPSTACFRRKMLTLRIYVWRRDRADKFSTEYLKTAAIRCIYLNLVYMYIVQINQNEHIKEATTSIESVKNSGITCQYLETQRSMQLFSPIFSSDSLYLVTKDSHF